MWIYWTAGDVLLLTWMTTETRSSNYTYIIIVSLSQSFNIKTTDNLFRHWTMGTQEAVASNKTKSRFVLTYSLPSGSRRRHKFKNPNTAITPACIVVTALLQFGYFAGQGQQRHSFCPLVAHFLRKTLSTSVSRTAIYTAQWKKPDNWCVRSATMLV